MFLNLLEGSFMEKYCPKSPFQI